MANWYENLSFDKEQIRSQFCEKIEAALHALEKGLSDFEKNISSSSPTEAQIKTSEQMKENIAKHQNFLRELQSLKIHTFTKNDSIAPTTLIIWGHHYYEKQYDYNEVCIEWTIPCQIICDVYINVDGYTIVLSDSDKNPLIGQLVGYEFSLGHKVNNIHQIFWIM